MTVETHPIPAEPRSAIAVTGLAMTRPRRPARSSGARLGLALLAAAALAPPLAAQRIAPAEARGVVDEAARPAPPTHLFEASGAPPVVLLPAAGTAAPAGLRAMQAWNAAGSQPRRNGFARDLPAPQEVRFPAALARSLSAGRARSFAGGVLAGEAGGGARWATQVRVEGAWRLRLHLDRVVLPAGARLWVYGGEGNPVPFGPELAGPQGDLWTPSVGGPSITLEVRLPPAALAGSAGAPFGFRLDRAMEIFDLSAGATGTQEGAATSTACLVDAACVGAARFTAVASVRRAIALLGHVTAGSFNAECTGALINDTDDSTTIPYLLTANHCFETQAEVAGIEAFFDDFRASCGGPAPNLDRLPRVMGGSTLVATSKQSDFTLIRLFAFPDNQRFLLGWDARALPEGFKLHQISHPLGMPQSYSEGTVILSPPPKKTCGNEGGRPLNDLSKFVYVQPIYGGTLVNSSGAPLMTDGGLVVGTLTDGCGPDPENGCDYRNLCANGRFSATYPQVASILNPSAGPQACIADAQTLCLNGGRFRVRTQWTTGEGLSGAGQAVPLTDDTGYFWFFNSANVEMVVKVLNACSISGRYWVFAGGLTDVQVQTNVTDMTTAAQRGYRNPQGTPFQPIQDTGAFETCP